MVSLFYCTIFFYLLGALGHAVSAIKLNYSFKNWTTWVEKAGFFFLTITLLIYGFRLYLGISQDLPFARLLLPWAFHFVGILMSSVYPDSHTGSLPLYGSILLFFIAPLGHNTPEVLQQLSFYQGTFILGCTFCGLGMLLWIRVLGKKLYFLWKTPKNKFPLDRHIQEIDYSCQRLVLFAIPLLTTALCSKILLMIDNHQLLGAIELIQFVTANVLPVLTWLTCSLYLYTRILLNWKYAYFFIYLLSFSVIAIAHLSSGISLRII